VKRKFLAFACLVINDCLAIFLCFSLAFLLRSEVFPGLFPSLQERPVEFGAYLSRAYMLLLWVSVFLYEKLYTKRHSFWEEARLLVKSNSISFGLVAVAVFLTKQYFPISRVVIFIAWLLSLAVLPIMRRATKMLLLRMSIWRKKAIVIGSTESTSTLVEAVEQNKMMGYEIVGCLTDEKSQIGLSISGVPILGHFDEIERWKEKTGFDDIIVTFPNIPRNQLISLLKRWEGVSDTIRYIPQTGDLITTGIEIENIGRVLSLVVRKNLHKPWNVLIKTVFEFALAAVMIVLFLPVSLIIAAAIRLNSRGPVLFVQERYGRRNRVIKVVKFRSMYVDADSRLESYLERHPQVREEWSKYRKLKNSDPRITRVGRFLRRHSLDELPQLLNVLIGEMSIVGPRPYLCEELEGVKPVKSLILQVKPGITGLWQTSGRSLLPFQDRIDIDEYYIRNWSLWLDLVILMRTVKVTFSGQGAF
jgi:Undecaprenyl-phosphate galactose phosphotransferase WbaP